MNEFTGASWDKPDPSDPTSGMTLGQEVLNFRGFSTQYYMCAGGGGAPELTRARLRLRTARVGSTVGNVFLEPLLHLTASPSTVPPSLPTGCGSAWARCWPR